MSASLVKARNKSPSIDPQEIQQALLRIKDQNDRVILGSLFAKRQRGRRPKRLKQIEFVDRETINQMLELKLPGNSETTADDLEKLARDRVLFRLTYLSAGRIGEVLKMKKRDFVVNERPGYVKISLPNFKNPNPGRQVKYQAIPLKDSFAEEILAYVNTLEDGSLLFPSKKYVFGWGWKTDNAKSMTTRTALRRLRYHNLGYVGEDEKFHKIWLHWFRHQRLGELAKQGIPDRQLAQISGHASTEMLDIYVHLNPYSISIQAG